MQIHIVEDEFIIAEELSFQLQRIGYQSNGISASYQQAVHFLQHNEIDLVLLDISIQGDKNGIDVAYWIQKNLGIPYIFLTSHTDKDTINEAKGAQPYAYLSKPYTEGDLYAAIEIALIQHQNRQEFAQTPTPQYQSNTPYIFLKFKDVYEKVSIEDIISIESDGNYIHIQTEHKKYALKSSIKKFLEQIRVNFLIRVHKSYVINLNKVSAITSKDVILGKYEIPIGRQYQKVLHQQLNFFN